MKVFVSLLIKINYSYDLILVTDTGTTDTIIYEPKTTTILSLLNFTAKTGALNSKQIGVVFFRSSQTMTLFVG